MYSFSDVDSLHGQVTGGGGVKSVFPSPPSRPPKVKFLKPYTLRVHTLDQVPVVTLGAAVSLGAVEMNYFPDSL